MSCHLCKGLLQAEDYPFYHTQINNNYQVLVYQKMLLQSQLYHHLKEFLSPCITLSIKLEFDNFSTDLN